MAFSDSSSSPPSTLLVVGAGGREHALIRAITQTNRQLEVHAAPGNPGMAADGAECHGVSADDIPGLVALVQSQAIEFVVVGPEVPLAMGLVDELAKIGIPAYGPTADGGELEASKTRTKEILQKYGIPTACLLYTSPSPRDRG